MADGSVMEASCSSQVNGESSESTVEVNIKTLDSQIYTFRVNKNIPVHSFKEKIANEIGVPVGQQRLIFRGKVLKDDHLLSEYHVEDGHTLHLVARQPVQSQPSPGTGSGDAAASNDGRGNDSTASVPRNRVGQVSHSVVLGTFNIGDQGEGIVPDLSRIIGAVLNSVGIGNLTTTAGANNSSPTPANNPSQASQGVEMEGSRANPGGRSQTGNQTQPGTMFLNHPFQSLHQSLQFPLTGGVAIPSQPMAIPDSLTTLLEFINRMEHVLSLNGYESSPSPSNARDSPSSDFSSSNVRGLPTPEALAIVIRRARLLLSDHGGAVLSHIAGRLEREGTTTESLVRAQIQTEAMQIGIAMQHLGALLLELGRTILMLRMGQSPAESAVNAGPAVYISPSGPNPIMVQPFPLQASSLFGGAVVAPQVNAGVVGPVGADISRNINIHIHAGTSTSASPVGSRTNAGVSTHQEQAFRTNTGVSTHQEQANTNGTASSDSGPTRVLPVRNVGAAVVGRSPAEGASHMLSVVYPVHARSQQANLSHSGPARGSDSAMSNGAQPSMDVSGSQPSAESVSLSTAVNQLNARIRNLVGNIRGEDSNGSTHQTAEVLRVGEGVQFSAGPLEASALQGSSISSGMGDEEGIQQREKTGVDGASEPRDYLGLSNISEDNNMSGNEGQQLQTDGSQFSNAEDTRGGMNTKQASSTSSMPDSARFSSVGTLLSNSDHSSERNANVQSWEDATRLSQSQELSKGGKTVPLGLGPGGLQPKRRSRQVKLRGQDGGTSNVSVNQDQLSVSRGQQVLQSLVSQSSDTVRTDSSGSSVQLPHVFGQMMDSLSLGSNGQLNTSNIMSQVLNSPSLNSMLSGLSEQTGVGSPDGLRNMLEQLTQSPSMRNTLNQITQEVENQTGDLGGMLSGFGRGQGGIDFSRMIQQMMPIVSQALGRGSTPTDPFHGVETEPQPLRRDNMPVRDSNSYEQNSQIDLQQAAHMIEVQDSPGNIFRSVLENARRLDVEVDSSEDLVEEICNGGLADEFMQMLQRDLRQRLQSAFRSADKS